jgi:hypothetical protein
MHKAASRLINNHSDDYYNDILCNNYIEINFMPSYIGFLLSLLFNPEDGSDMSFRTVKLSPNYKALQLKNPYPSYILDSSFLSCSPIPHPYPGFTHKCLGLSAVVAASLRFRTRPRPQKPGQSIRELLSAGRSRAVRSRGTFWSGDRASRATRQEDAETNVREMSPEPLANSMRPLA